MLAYVMTAAASSSSFPPPPPVLCDNTCLNSYGTGGQQFINNRHCQDGHAGADGAQCNLGTDCDDCGPREYLPPSPPPPSSPPPPPPPLPPPPPVAAASGFATPVPAAHAVFRRVPGSFIWAGRPVCKELILPRWGRGLYRSDVRLRHGLHGRRARATPAPATPAPTPTPTPNSA